uniref:SRF-dependent transcription regulation-associated protein n=1 Tax=Haemonchus contortus TaxID=6289 RepID=A0A7I5E5I8_HAECO
MAPKKKSSNKSKPKQKNKHESETDEENYEVVDLSAVPTPKVEFMMPNLTPLESYKSEPKPKPKQKPKKRKASSSGGHVLTAEQLNNEIVGMRAVINKARMSLVRHLVRKLKRLKSVVAKKPSEVLQRKMRRYEEEIHAMKSIARDDVSKFALLNKKSLNELRITGRTPVTERCLWKLACERCVVKAVEEYRTRYPDSEATTAFFLQRLGLQYSVDKEMNNLKSLDSKKDEDDDDDSQEACFTIKAVVNTKRREPSVSESESGASDGGVSNRKGRVVDSDISSEEDRGIGIGTDSDDDGGEAAENRRKLLLGSPMESSKSTNKKKSLKKSKGSVLRNDTSTSLKREAGTKAVIKQVKLSEGGEIELGKPVQMETVDVVSENGHENESPSYSFFLPASAVPDIATTSPKAAVPQKPERVKKLKKSSGEMESGSPIKLKKKKMLPDNKITSEAKESHIPIEATALEKHVRAKKLKKSSVGKGNDDPVTLKKKKMLPDHQINSKARESHIPIDELHPSWAARRRAKEQQNMAPQGKRIVFSDD